MEGKRFLRTWFLIGLPCPILVKEANASISEQNCAFCALDNNEEVQKIASSIPL
jgi:hypothetical protein